MSDLRSREIRNFSLRMRLAAWFCAPRMLEWLPEKLGSARKAQEQPEEAQGGPGEAQE